MNSCNQTDMVHFNINQGEQFQHKDVFLSLIMVLVHLGLHRLLKYPLRGFEYAND